MKTTTVILFDEAIKVRESFHTACRKYYSCDTELIQAKARLNALLNTIYKCDCLPEFLEYVNSR
ncbi:MAG: hypothetical protein SOX69_09600 [Oscillospiraceae bacterium]|nr:hypothetical protein [Oscillospiraceae bacterium]